MRINIGIDNGVSGTIGIIKEDESIFVEMPTISQLNYTKKKANITRIDWQKLIVQLVQDSLHENKAKLCYKVFYSLARSISTISNVLNVDALAFSGGVFQNALLIDLIIKEMGGKKELYFHKQLSPNDENIGFGQLVYVAQKIDTGSSVLFKSE